MREAETPAGTRSAYKTSARRRFSDILDAAGKKRKRGKSADGAKEMEERE